MRLRSTFIAPLAVLVTLGATALSLPSDMVSLRSHESGMAIIAHRGDSSAAPENTIPAFRAAAAAHATYVELDLMQTSDHQVVVLHDPTLARTTNVAQIFPGRQHDPVGSFTLAQIERLDAGSWKGPQWAGTKVPTLQQVLEATAGSGIKLMVEPKGPIHDSGYLATIAHQIDSSGFAHRVVITSFHLAALRGFHRVDPGLRLNLILKHPASTPPSYPWLSSVSPKAGHFDQAYVAAATARHLAVYAYGTSGMGQLRTLQSWDVAGAATDQPAAASRTLSATVAP